MHISTLLLRHSRTSPNFFLSSLTFLRSMGGGPRTFPGGLNKWQWKRLHEKKAREKEKKLLDQEKQLYQARIRSQIRAELAPQERDNKRPDPNYRSMSSDDHIKALADRFMKAGAEDLWNEADGPVKSPAPTRLQPPAAISRPFRTPIDLRKLISESDRSQNSTDLNDSSKRRYSVYTRNPKGSRFNFRRNESDDSESEDDFSRGVEEEIKGGDGVKRLMSSAALGKFDVKKTRRVPLKFLELEEDLSQQVEAIRREVKNRNSIENGMDKSDEDSILSEKRFDECDVSPLTVKALSQAGYVQMTRVQEATLSVCLDAFC